MNELIKILMDINPNIDYKTEDKLIDKELYDSFSIISLVTQISSEFDIDISPKYLVPHNFNSAEAIWNMIQRIQEE